MTKIKLLTVFCCCHIKFHCQLSIEVHSCSRKVQTTVCVLLHDGIVGDAKMDSVAKDNLAAPNSFLNILVLAQDPTTVRSLRFVQPPPLQLPRSTFDEADDLNNQDDTDTTFPFSQVVLTDALSGIANVFTIGQNSSWQRHSNVPECHLPQAARYQVPGAR